MLLHAIIISLSSFLIFLVQPLIAKFILPWFGGSASVWSVCILFFQFALLLGYAYSHCCASVLKPRYQALMQMALIAAAFWCLPIIPLYSKQPGAESPITQILSLLLISIGAPYFVLASTTPLLQAWAAIEHKDRSPYWLYSLSNLFSLTALLSFPTLLEPWLEINKMAWLWSFIFLAYGIAMTVMALRLFLSDKACTTTKQADSHTNDGIALRIYWLALSFCPCLMLLAITNHICQEIAVVPFLWVMPLALYLLSFVICFSNLHKYLQRWYLLLLLISMGGLVPTLIFDETKPTLTVVAANLILLFSACLALHGELADSKPDAGKLTGYYFATAIGGALAGLFVVFVAPSIYTHFSELIAALVLVALLGFRIFLGSRRPGNKIATRDGILLAGLAALSIPISIVIDRANNDLDAKRNFYGVVAIQSGQLDDGAPYRSMRHGSTIHGIQLLDPIKKMEPTTYFSKSSGIGIILKQISAHNNVKIGIIGLGAGTLAAYGNQGDLYRIYEINPAVTDLAQKYFSFLADSKATVTIVPGDARLSLEEEPSNNFDLLVVDAFSGDSIPAHLLTLEAIQLYQRHLNPGGFIAAHISNRHIDIAPVISAAASRLGLYHGFIVSRDTKDQLAWPSTWAVLSKDGQILKDAGVAEQITTPAGDRALLRPWSDRYSNIFQLIR